MFIKAKASILLINYVYKRVVNSSVKSMNICVPLLLSATINNPIETVLHSKFAYDFTRSCKCVLRLFMNQNNQQFVCVHVNVMTLILLL